MAPLLQLAALLVLLLVVVALRASGPPAVEAGVDLPALRRRTSAHQPPPGDGDDEVGVGGPSVGPPEADRGVPHDVQYLLWAGHGAPQPPQ